MEIGKPLLFMITSISLFALLVGGMSSAFTNGTVDSISTDKYFQGNGMLELMNFTFLEPASFDLATHPRTALPIENVPITTGGWGHAWEFVFCDKPSVRFTPVGGGDDVQCWVVHKTLWSGYQDIRIIFFQIWGIGNAESWEFTYNDIINKYDSEKGYALLTTTGMSLPYYLTVMPDIGTVLANDLQFDRNYTIYCSVADKDASKLSGGAWGMISHIMTFSVPNWNPIISTIIGVFVDGFIFLSIFLIVRSFVPFISGGGV